MRKTLATSELLGHLSLSVRRFTVTQLDLHATVSFSFTLCMEVLRTREMRASKKNTRETRSVEITVRHVERVARNSLSLERKRKESIIRLLARI